LLLTLSVCLPNCKSILLFLFLDGIEPFFGHQFSMIPSTKCCSSIFDLRPLTPKIYSQIPHPQNQIDSSSLFLDGIEPFFRPSLLHDPSTKRCSSMFDLGPLMPQIYSPKFGLKSPISRFVWQINRACVHLPVGFRGWPIQ